MPSLKQRRFRKERASFKSLLIANPNYFGNLKESSFEPVLSVQSNTFYERIGCVGYQPQFRRLEAVVFVEQPNGYGGDICSDGSVEYVRFYLSFDGGASWKDQGLSSFQTYDMPECTEGEKRLEYAVTRRVDPPEKYCLFHNIIQARAILSWNAPPPPDTPDFVPVWGNVQNANIQAEHFKSIVVDDFFTAVGVETPPQLAAIADLTQALPAKKPKLSTQELQELYKDKDVEPQRFAFEAVQQLIGSQAVDEALFSPDFQPSLPGLDIGDILSAIEVTDGNTSFEELKCVGLNTEQDTLVGVIQIKRPFGYSGGPCTDGSREYVAFWGDFNGDGQFEKCLGVTSVNVYDFDDIPEDGLEYSVFLPVDLDRYRQPCEEGPRCVRIRAILSWNQPPPCADNVGAFANWVPTYGNREETLVHITPGRIDGLDQVPFLSAVGDIGESKIGVNGKANGTAIQTGFLAADSPFGGRITLAGHISNSTPGLKYRVMRKLHGAPDADYVPLTREPHGIVLTINQFNGTEWTQNDVTLHADTLGYYDFEDYSSNHSVEDDIMMVWDSSAGEDGQIFDLRIDLSTDGNPANDVHSNEVTVLVDNTPPEVELEIDLGTGVQCADFDAGTTFNGSFKSTDKHFYRFQFAIQPSGPPNFPSHGALPVPASGTSVHYGGAIADPGVASGTYTLDTSPMDPCGYSLTLHVWDRTNVNSGKTRYHRQASVGFCLRAPQPG